MAYGFNTYPWVGTSAYTSGQTVTITPTFYSSSGTYYDYNWPVQQQEAERPKMPESPMEWLKRRVTEVTDLAYAGI